MCVTGCYEAVQKAIQKQKAIPLVRLGCKVELEELTAAEATTTVEAAPLAAPVAATSVAGMAAWAANLAPGDYVAASNTSLIPLNGPSERCIGPIHRLVPDTSCFLIHQISDVSGPDTSCYIRYSLPHVCVRAKTDTSFPIHI